jgi:hypothetical protein
MNAGRPWITFTANDPASFVLLRRDQFGNVVRVAGPMPAAEARAMFCALTAPVSPSFSRRTPIFLPV